MADDLNSVNIDSSARSYHHGALRQALIRAAQDLIAERGVDGFSLRETARRAGVSPAAPGHHFKDARGLLTAVAAEAFLAFGDALEEAGKGADRESRIRAQGMAYVRFALTAPASFDLLWRKSLINPEDPAYAAAGRRAFGILDGAVRGQARPSTGGLERYAAPSIAAWSMVHGFACLARDGVFGTEEGAAERAVEALLPSVLDHLDI